MIGLACWFACSVIAYGLALGHFTRRFPYVKHMTFCVLFSLLGPGALIVALIKSDVPYTWRIKPLSAAERQEADRKTFGVQA